LKRRDSMFRYRDEWIRDFLGQGGGGGGTSVTLPPLKRTPEEHLARLKFWFGDGTKFNWSSPPTTTTRGVFPTRLHVESWYDHANALGYDLEDIGFGKEELLDIWAVYARETFPVVYGNYNKRYGNDLYPME